MAEHLSPKQVARAIGVSESSLKRWVDQGRIPAIRTAGGHRKLALDDVLRFLKEGNIPLIDPEILLLPAVSPQSESGLNRGAELLFDALVNGSEELARQVIFDLYIAQHSLCVIFDRVILVAFAKIGELWSCGDVEIYQERRGCEIIIRILHEMRRTIAQTDARWLAIGGTMSGDHYTIPNTMAEMIVRDAGWHTRSLGTCLPAATLIKALAEKNVRLMWLSVSHIEKESDFLREFTFISEAATRHGVALVVGGRALNESLRKQLTYSAYCDTMLHLDQFARTLRQSHDTSHGGIENPK